MGADYESAIQNHRFDLLYLGDVLAGLIETVDEKDQLLIENVAVSPEFQGLGLGSKLMAHAEEIATSLGYDRVSLYTNQRFSDNIALYCKLGYHIEREEDVGGGTIKVDMSNPQPSTATAVIATQGFDLVPNAVAGTGSKSISSIDTISSGSPLQQWI
jgi:predicted GNAT family acetyltransferase